MSNIPIKPNELTLQRLKEKIIYDADTGILYRKLKNRLKEVKCESNVGYYRITNYHETYQAHHVAWFLYYRYWPTKQIDHKDMNQQNNKINNLIEATGSQQNLNKTNASKEKYIYYYCKKYNIVIPGDKELGIKIKYLGRYEDINVAIQKRNDYLESLHAQ